MRQKIKIRQAQLDDLDAVSELLRQLHDQHPWRDSLKEKAEATLVEIINHPRRYLFVAEIDDAVVGTNDLTIVPNLTHQLSPWGMIENVIVSNQYRNLGVAIALMQSALDQAQREGCYKVELISADYRTASHQLYQKLGFQENAKAFRFYF